MLTLSPTGKRQARPTRVLGSTRALGCAWCLRAAAHPALPGLQPSPSMPRCVCTTSCPRSRSRPRDHNAITRGWGRAGQVRQGIERRRAGPMANHATARGWLDQRRIEWRCPWSSGQRSIQWPSFSFRQVSCRSVAGCCEVSRAGFEGGVGVGLHCWLGSCGRSCLFFVATRNRTVLEKRQVLAACFTRFCSDCIFLVNILVNPELPTIKARQKTAL